MIRLDLEMIRHPRTHRAGLLDMERVLASRTDDALAAQDASTHSAGDDRRSAPPSP